MDITGLFNLALGRVGSNEAVGAPTDKSVHARTCARFYDHCRRTVLRAFPWNFAFASVALAELLPNMPGYDIMYSYPANAVRVLAVCDAAGIRPLWTIWSDPRWRWSNSNPVAWQVPFRIALRPDNSARVIVTDLGSAFALYTADVENTGAMSDDFQDVLAWRLAMEIGGPLKCSKELVDGAEQRYRLWASHAQATSLNESRSDPEADSESVTCRA